MKKFLKLLGLIPILSLAANFFTPIPLTTKGDIFGYSTKPTRCSVGTDGQVLTADSASSCGFKWSAASGGTFIGKAIIQGIAACDSLTRSSSTLGSFASDADCLAPSIPSGYNPGPGTIQTTDFDGPKIQVNSLESGTYEICVSGGVLLSTNQRSTIGLTDGTTIFATQNSNGNNPYSFPIGLCGIIIYATTANRTFEIIGATESGGLMTYQLTDPNSQTTFTIKKLL